MAKARMINDEAEYEKLVDAHTALVWQKYWIEIQMIKLESTIRKNHHKPYWPGKIHE